jgi:DnaJ-class molecular chaperone
MLNKNLPATKSNIAKIIKDDVQKAYIKIQKKIHPDISPETTRLSMIVNEAKEVVLKNLV